MRITEIQTPQSRAEAMDRFAAWAMDYLGISSPPTIRYGSDPATATKKRTFGTTKSSGEIWVHVGERVPADAMRTLAHELVHHHQFLNGKARDGMDKETTDRIEDEANAIAGRMMREYGKVDGAIYEGWSAGGGA